MNPLNRFLKAWEIHMQASETAKKAGYAYFLEMRDGEGSSEEYAFSAAVSVAIHRRDDLMKEQAA